GPQEIGVEAVINSPWILSRGGNMDRIPRPDYVLRCDVAGIQALESLRRLVLIAKEAPQTLEARFPIVLQARRFASQFLPEPKCDLRALARPRSGTGPE